MNEQAIREALLAYAAAYACPGFDVGDGNLSGCDQRGGDCPTHHAVIAAQEEQRKAA